MAEPPSTSPHPPRLRGKESSALQAPGPGALVLRNQAWEGIQSPPRSMGTGGLLVTHTAPVDADVIGILTYNVWFNEECQVSGKLEHVTQSVQ